MATSNSYTALVRYLGNLRTEVTHPSSGSILYTDAPKDNYGKGENFSPTDLLACSWAACASTIIGIAIEQQKLPPLEFTCTVQKVMQNNPRKIAKLSLGFYIKGPELTQEQKKILEECIWQCPVSLSLDPNIEKKADIFFEVYV
ncbi:MAG: OsmC family protein [Bacteroidia bacterium]|nr:OsmC family protein [Bacteroidia bacterium]MDW8159036.1 OsmC family protein [Bacteroidia bacterium]